MSHTFCCTSLNPFVLLFGCQGKTFYSMVEKKYWDVSLFGYYQLRHLPDFLIAAPSLFLGIAGCVRCSIWALHTQSLWILPLVAHSFTLITICLTTANVQIVTRLLLSSSPLFVWEVVSFAKRWHILLVYWVGYCIVGSVVFALFLPWTFHVCLTNKSLRIHATLGYFTLCLSRRIDILSFSQGR